MDWIFDNPLANLPGTYFLLLYGAMIVTLAIAFQIIKRQFDMTSGLPLPPIPANPDVYEIAYLRGGENELARAVIFTLAQKGFLQIQTTDNSAWVQQSEIKPDKRSLNYLEQKVYDYFAMPYQTREIFAKSSNLREILKPFATTYAQRLENAQLLTAAEANRQVNILKWTIFLGILALGGYKFLAAILNGYSNVGFLIVFSFAALLIFASMNGLPRVSALGRKYLEMLELTFATIKSQISQPNPKHPQFAAQGARFGAVDPMLLAVGVFGVGALAGTAYDSYHQAFYKSQQQNAGSASSGSSCGSGCGSSWDSSSSSDSGGSCSSGGSSCGGGGCGGGCS